jgi:hypothetical protein
MVNTLKGTVAMISPEHILNTLRNWRLEMNSPHNDGWVQQGYREKLSEVEAFFEVKHLDEALASCSSCKPNAVRVYEDEIELYETYGGD